MDLLPSSKGRRRKQEDPEFSISTAGTQGWDSGASSAHPPKLSQVPVWGQEGRAAGTETGQDFHLPSCLPKNPTIPVSRTCLRVIFCLLRAAPRAQRAPGLPRALQQCPVSAGCPQEAGAAGIDAPEMEMRKSHLPPSFSIDFVPSSSSELALLWPRGAKTYLGSAATGHWRSELFSLLSPLDAPAGSPPFINPWHCSHSPVTLSSCLACVETAFPGRECCYLHWSLPSFSFPGRSPLLPPQLHRLFPLVPQLRQICCCLSFPISEIEKFLSPGLCFYILILQDEVFRM